MGKYVSKIKNLNKSVKIKLFLTLCIAVLCIIFFLIILNSFALEKFYLYSKQKTLKDIYYQLNNYYNGNSPELDLESELEKIEIQNNFDISEIILRNQENS